MAVLFDLDGTLIDTEKYYRKCWPAALEHFGYHITDEESLTLRSLGRPFAIEHLKQLCKDPDLDYEAVREYRKMLFEECLEKEGLNVKPGAVELLQFLKEHHITAAVATATDTQRACSYLEKAGLLPYFDKVISATMVQKGKPAPDVYLYACEQLGELPRDCYAVEDAPNGVKSAYAAGCKVIMVPDQTPPDAEIEGMLFACVDNLAAIGTLLLSRCR